DFRQWRSQLIAIAIAITPAVFSILQNETGLALVYFAFFIVLYREGLPPSYMIIGFYVAILIVASILVNPNTLAIILTVTAVLALLLFRRKIRRNKLLMVIIVVCWLISVGIQRFVVPFLFETALQPYQVERIMSMFGKDYMPQDSVKAA